MANEATVISSLQIRKGNVDYQSRPTSYQADVASGKGPSPGALTVPTGGRVIDLSELATLGLCKIANIDETTTLRWGLYDLSTNTYMPVGKMLPGEFTVLRLDLDIEGEYSGTGTGTIGIGNRLFLRGDGASCEVLVEAFEA